MTDLFTLLRQLAVARPDGSAAAARAADLIARILAGTGVTPVRESFFLRPHLPVLTGLAMLLLAAGAAAAVWRRKRIPAVLLALAIPLVYLGEFEFNLPIVSWLGGRTGENIVAEYGPADTGRTLILAAHYDTKTEVFDHEQRKPIHNAVPYAMLLIFLAAILGALGRILPALDREWPRRLLMLMAAGGIAGLSLLAYAFGGAYFLRAKSPGARDDGTSVAILLGVAQGLAKGEIDPGRTRVRLVFFGGEEVNMQGSQAYAARHRAELDRAAMINLETLSGPGPYRYHRRTGTFLRKFASSVLMRDLLNAALAAKGLPAAKPAGAIYDDSMPFAARGVPVITASNGTGRDSYHNAGDSLDKVVPGRMEEAVGVIGEMVKEWGSR